MKEFKHEICVVMPRYALGEAIPLSQDRAAPFDLFSLRKHLERYGLNEYTIKIVRMRNPFTLYAFAFDINETGISTLDEYVTFISGKLECESTVEAVSTKLNDILTKFIYENNNVHY